MNKLPPSTEARQKTNEVKEANKQKELEYFQNTIDCESIIRHIEAAIQDGKYECSIPTNINVTPTAIKALHYLGYGVIPPGRGQSYYIICW